MDEYKIEKLKRFANDQQMSDAVKDVIETELGQPSKDRDVNMLAAHFLAIEIIKTAWKEIEKYKLENEVEDKIAHNVGL
jgi:hypothetical protein